jgi:hypothetical protein
MSALAGLLAMTALFGWLGLITSLLLDVIIGVALAAVISVIFRLANGV